MLLRRIIEHVEDQNWVAVVIDFVIVVIGVFVGIQVSNWNSHRVERLQEQELLVRLHEDFVASVDGQTRDIRFLQQQSSDQGIILRSLSACQVADGNDLAFQRGVVTLGYINPPRFFRRTVDELASAGTTNIIQSDDIKNALADIIALVEWRSNADDKISRLTEQHRLLVEREIRYEVDRIRPDPFVGELPHVRYDIERLCQNPQIASAVSAVSQLTRDRERAYQPILERYQAILPLLEQELDERWGVDINRASQR